MKSILWIIFLIFSFNTYAIDGFHLLNFGDEVNPENLKKIGIDAPGKKHIFEDGTYSLAFTSGTGVQFLGQKRFTMLFVSKSNKFLKILIELPYEMKNHKTIHNAFKEKYGLTKNYTTSEIGSVFSGASEEATAIFANGHVVFKILQDKKSRSIELSFQDKEMAELLMKTITPSKT